MADLHLTLLTIRTKLRCKSTSDGYSAHCPCHSDRTASLSIAVKHDRVLLKCFAGCPTQAILDRIGLDWPDLFADGVEGRKRRCRPAFFSTPPKKCEAPRPDFVPLLAAARKHPQHHQKLLDLADHLGALPEAREAYANAAEAIGVVWLSKCPTLSPMLPYKGRGWKACWGIPERDADGKVIGITRRYPDGSKKAFPNGKRGLTYSPRLEGATDQPVSAPEGASDVISLMACGLRAIGRPSNVGGVDILAEVVSTLPAGQTVIVLGENDQKVTSEGEAICPGRVGMSRTAAQLANSLPSHQIAKSMPPANSKDARSYLAGKCGLEVGLAFLAALVLVTCPYNPLNTVDQEEAGESTDTNRLPDLLADLPDPPPSCACRRGGASLLAHTEDASRHRSCRHACDSWSCPVCRERNAHQWVSHLAGCVESAARGGCTLHTAEVTRERFDRSFARSIRRRRAAWCALELLPGVLLVLLALPAGDSSPAGSAPTTLEDATSQLVRWAKQVRVGPEPFSKARAKARPVRTSKNWQLHRPESSGEWKVVCPIDTQSPDDVLAVVRREGASVTCDTTEPGESGGSSLIWLVEWRADPDTTVRIIESLKQIDACPAGPPPGGSPSPDDPFSPPVEW